MIAKYILPILLTVFAMTTINAKPKHEMTDKEHLTSLYEDMYRAMIAKDTVVLDKMLNDGFVLVHMTGMRQPKREYLRSIANGTLNYYSCDDTNLDITVNGDNARMIGQSQVLAAVFGGVKHRWPLQLDMTLKKDNGKWQIIQAVASTY